MFYTKQFFEIKFEEDRRYRIALDKRKPISDYEFNKFFYDEPINVLIYHKLNDVQIQKAFDHLLNLDKNTSKIYGGSYIVGGIYYSEELSTIKSWYIIATQNFSLDFIVNNYSEIDFRFVFRNFSNMHIRTMSNDNLNDLLFLCLHYLIGDFDY
jgi:hypothetical protein